MTGTGRRSNPATGPWSFGLTTAGRAAVAVAVIATVIGWLIGLTESYVLAAAAAAAVLTSAVRAMLLRPRLEVQRLVSPDRVEAGGTFGITLEVTNTSGRRSTPVVLEERYAGVPLGSGAITPLASGHRTEMTLELPTTRRGVIEVGTTSVGLVDPFGLVDRRAPCCGTTELIVWPRSWPVVIPDDRSTGSGTIATGRRSDPTRSDEFSTLGEYVPGDDPRHVHWPSSARTGRLVVRRFDTLQPHHTHLLLERYAENPSAFEVAVSICASLLMALDRNGETVTLCIATLDHMLEDSIVVSTVNGDSTGPRRAMDELARVRPQIRSMAGTGTTTDGLRARRIDAMAAAMSDIRTRGVTGGVDRLIIIGPDPGPADVGDDPAPSVVARRFAGHAAVSTVGVPATASIASMDAGAAQAMVDRRNKPSDRMGRAGRHAAVPPPLAGLG